MSDLQLQPIAAFGDHRLTAVRFADSADEWWFTSQISTALGYCEPRELARYIKRKWSDDFAADEVLTLQGQELSALRSSLPFVHPNARSVTLVNRSGLYGILMLTRQPAGTAFRRWLRDVALPGLEGKQIVAEVRAVAATPAPSPVTGVVYFVKAVGTDFVKIGWTRNLKRRLASMRTHCPHHLRCVRSELGDQATERQYHQRFAHLHVRREWFRADLELATFLKKGGQQ